MSARHKLLALALAALLGHAPMLLAQAQQDPADRLLQERRSAERLERLQQQTPEIAAPAVTPADDGSMDPAAIDDPEPTFLIGSIVLRGDTLLPAAQTDRILQPFIGKRLGVNRINLLLRRLTQAFIEAGYITTRAYVGSQNLGAGTLELTVIPGTIEKLRYNGREIAPGGLSDPGVRLALPFREGEPLDLADLEQGIDQLNRLRRNRAEMKILPGDTPGGSIVAIDNSQAERFYYTLGADNQGTRVTGQMRARAAVEANDLLGLQESLGLAFVGSRDTNALLFSAAVPWGYNTLSYTYAYSEFQNLIGDTALLFGTSRGHTLAFNRVLARSRAGKRALDVSLALREARRDINNIELTPHKLAVLRLAYNELRRFPDGALPGYWTVDVGLSRGLRAFGAVRDAQDLPGEAARAQFTKLDAALGLGLQVRPGFDYRATLAAQWANTPLYGSEQFFIGGANSVRGFAESALGGERGISVRNELAYTRLPALLGERARLEPFVFADAGQVQLVAEGTWRALAGAGLGVRTAASFGSAQDRRNAAVELALAKPVHWPDGLPDTKFRMHATLTLTF